jgi:hypothetical protein
MLLKTVRKVVIAMVGGTVLLLGIIMLVTPGPGLGGILAGLAILATEFVFARRLLKKAKDGARAVGERTGVISRRPVGDSGPADATGDPKPDSQRAECLASRPVNERRSPGGAAQPIAERRHPHS